MSWRTHVAVVAAGVTLLAGAAVVAHQATAAPGVLLGLGVASVGYVAMVGLVVLRGLRLDRASWVVALFAALGARAVLIVAPPVLEDDVYRYLWDGAVTHHGESAYHFSPQEIMDRRQGKPHPTWASAPEVARLDRLAALSRTPALEPAYLRINYPSVPTIYPPAAQAVFAAVDMATPGRARTMKVAFVLLDLLTAAAVAWGLATLKRPREWLLVYLWSPLILVSFAGAGHMDALPMAALALTFVATLQRRPLLTGAALGVAIGSKLFALALLPLLVRRLGVRGIVVAVATVMLLYLPFLHEPRLFEGLHTYATMWRFNSAAFAPLAALGGDGAARLVAAALVAAVSLIAARGAGTGDVLVRAAAVLVALIVLAPAVNPWYVAWLAPLVAWLAAPALLALSLGVLGYYVHFLPGGAPAWWPWAEFGPALVVAIALASTHFLRIHLPWPDSTISHSGSAPR